jgi:carbonic anhydrase
MKSLVLFFACAVMCAMSPTEAYNKLVSGNKRFANDIAKHPDQGEKRRLAVTDGQAPFAVIVACADSRVAPEIIFDQGLGDLFVIRVAGNVVGPFEMASIVYATEHLNSSCVVVMGHQNCGAVTAVVKDHTEDIPFIGRLIQPAVDKSRDNKSRDVLKMAIQYNATDMAKFVAGYRAVRPKVAEKKVVVKSAYYDMDSGKVIFL